MMGLEVSGLDKRGFWMAFVVSPAKELQKDLT